MKTSTCVVMLDGVLRKIIGNDPIRPGLLLFKALATEFAVVIVSSKPGDVAWLDEQGIKNDMTIPDEGKSHLLLLNELKFEFGYTIDLVVEPDPEQAAKILDAGYTTILYAHPYYAHPSWRPSGPGSAPETWQEIRRVVTRGTTERASDARLRGEDS